MDEKRSPEELLAQLCLEPGFVLVPQDRFEELVRARRSATSWRPRSWAKTGMPSAPFWTPSRKPGTRCSWASRR